MLKRVCIFKDQRFIVCAKMKKKTSLLKISRSEDTFMTLEEEPSSLFAISFIHNQAEQIK